MEISKILNNNTAVVIDDDQIEKIVVGKGIAFQKKKGDRINLATVEKTFCLSSNTLNTKFQDIIISLPIEQIYVVEKIVNEIRLTLGKKISDSIYISLSDHIHFSLLDYAKGIEVTNSILMDIIRFYPDEYKLGCRGIEIIQEETGVLLSKDEAGFIALHIVNAQTQNATNTKNVYKATKIIEEILTIVENYFDAEIDESSIIYFRLINHLRYFSMRIVGKDVFKDSKKDSELLEILAVKYKNSYQCCLNIRSFIKVKYEVDIGCEELLYLTIHIQRAMYKDEE